MNENEMQRLQFASTIREAAKSLRGEAESQYLHRFNKENQRQSGEQGKTWDPTVEAKMIATQNWRQENSLDKFIPVAVEELRRIDKLIQQIN